MTDTHTLLKNRPPSLATLFLQRVAETPDAEAFRYPVPPASGRARRLAAADLGRVRRAGLRGGRRADLPGVLPEERVALASSTRVEWVLTDLGVLCAGAATTTVYPQTNAEETAFILADSGSRVLIAEDAAQLAKAREKRAELPELAHVVVIEERDAVPADGDPEGWVLSSPSWRSAAPRCWPSVPRWYGNAPTPCARSSWPRSSTPPAPPGGPRAYGWRTTPGRTWPS
ncbi:AMP-binding protein [Streptomyces sp. M19]